MTAEGPGREGVPSLTSLPKFEDIPARGDGLDTERVREAFDAFRRHTAQLQAQLRVLQAAGRSSAASSRPSCLQCGTIFENNSCWKICWAGGLTFSIVR